jgi:hypothetical protein
MKKFREKRIIRKIQKIQRENISDWIKYLSLNSIQSHAAALVLDDKISLEFYKAVFHGGDLYNHWSDVNAEYINNFLKRA